MANQESSFVQRSRSKIHFQHEDMDYYLSWIMGRHIYAGSDPEECLETASRIEDGDPDSWRAEWTRTAERVEAEADRAKARGERARARGGYLRACSYYRAPLFIMKADHPAFVDLAEKMRSCFRSAVEMSDSPLETVEVPYQGERLVGYFGTVGEHSAPRPLFVIVGGIETFAEDCYFMIGPTALQHGYSILTVDLPGQGFNPFAGVYFGAKMHLPMEAVLDYALGRPDVEGHDLVVYGFSWGGHIVFKAGEHDRRINALIANPPMPNVFRASLAQQQGHDRDDPIAQRVFLQIAWRMGLKISFNPADIARRFGKAYDYLFHGRADARQIECPTLCLAGEAEAPITLEIARETMGKLPHPDSRLKIFTDQDGSSAHCQVDNLDVPNQAIFDWLGSLASVSGT